jgi:hypothetical protein
LSLLLRLSWDMSFCRLETIEFMLKSWVEIESNGCIGGGGDRVGVFVTFCSGGSRMCGGMVIVCRAIIVADGGVFSPRKALWLGRTEEVSFISNRVDGVGVGVPCLEEIGSGSLTNGSLPK